MSHSTESDVCHNVLVVGPYEDFYNRLCMLYEFFEEDDLIGNTLLKGWYIKDLAVECGDNNLLYGLKLHKHEGAYEVFMINTDFYEHVGGYDYTVFSNDRDAVLAFYDDFKDICSSDVIQDQAAVSQTL